jgi:hypothetical protein
MMPEEWPIAADAAQRNASARRSSGNRLATVRADFFLNAEERLSEQERALMTAMLHCLVGEIADELRAALPVGWAAANDESNAALVETLAEANLLDDADLVAMLLRRADEERIATGAKARGGRRDARALQGLVSHDEGSISAAAMALILARGRRRDRFGQCLVDFDDLSPETAERLVHAIAAALRRELASLHGPGEADAMLAAAAQQLLSRFDPDRSHDALTAELVRLLNDHSALTDDLLLAAAHEGEIAFLAHAFARRATIPADSAIEELLSADSRRIIPLLRVADAPRELAAGLLAGVGDLLGVTDPGEAIVLFDRMTEADVAATRAWLSAAPGYRAALAAFRNRNGQRSL